VTSVEGVLFFIGITSGLGGVGGKKVAQKKIVVPYRTTKRDGLHVESGWQTLSEVEPSWNTGLAECLVAERPEPVRDCGRRRESVQAEQDVHDRFGRHADDGRAANVLDS